MSTETPRTEAAAIYLNNDSDRRWVSEEKASEIERELLDEIKRLQDTIAYVTKTLAPFDCGAAPVEELARRAAKSFMQPRTETAT